MKEHLSGNGPFRGFWSATAHPVALELAATLEPHYIAIDLQHGTEFSQITSNTFTALDRYGVPGLVRVAENDTAAIGRCLDLGAAGVIVPFVDTPEEAAAAAASCRYQPAGVRSFGMQTPRVPAGVDTALCLVQIETQEGLENVEDIVATEGVDGIYLGPADLGMSLGGPPAFDVVSIFDGSHPMASTLADALRLVAKAATSAGKIAGIHCGSAAATLAAESNGFNLSSIATDISAMRRDMALQLALASKE